MDYIFENALNIMYLCFGAGFLMISFHLAGVLSNANKMIKKVNSIVDILDTVIQRPLQVFMAAQNVVGRFFKIFF